MPAKTRKDFRKESARAAKFDSVSLEKAMARAESLCATLLGDADLKDIKLKDPNDIYKVVNALTGLARARIEMARWRSDWIESLKEARGFLQEEFRRAVPDRPELLEELQKIYDASIATEEERLMLEE